MEVFFIYLSLTIVLALLPILSKKGAKIIESAAARIDIDKEDDCDLLLGCVVFWPVILTIVGFIAFSKYWVSKFAN